MASENAGLTNALEAGRRSLRAQFAGAIFRHPGDRVGAPQVPTTPPISARQAHEPLSDACRQVGTFVA